MTFGMCLLHSHACLSHWHCFKNLQGQWEVLLRASGFELATTYPTRSLFTVTEARAA